LSKRVGVTRKTGYRWRGEASGVVPDRLTEAVRSIGTLSDEAAADRCAASKGQHARGLPDASIATHRQLPESCDGTPLGPTAGGYDSTMGTRGHEAADPAGRSRLPIEVGCLPGGQGNSRAADIRGTNAY
jgi:hypothetical protein